MPGSDFKAWWLGSCGHQWQATVTNRRRGTGCPTCTRPRGPRAGKIQPDQYPQLHTEWDSGENVGRRLTDYGVGSKYQAAWICPQGHRYRMRIHHRTKPSGGVAAGCPYCFGRYPTIGVSDLAYIAPEVANTWHPTKNGALQPERVHAAANAWCWWQCKHGHEWSAQVYQRTVFGTGCPTCYGRLVEAGFNDLATLRPDIAAEWHPTKNGALKPSEVAVSPATEVWWLAACGHEWCGPIARRTSGRQNGCPKCVLIQTSKIEHEFFTELDGNVLTDAQHGAQVLAPWGRRRFAKVDILGTYRGRGVVVEYDGSYWHAEKLDADTEKTAALLTAEYVVIRVREQSRDGTGLPPLPLAHRRLAQFNHRWGQAGELERVVGKISDWLTAQFA
ncbi:zinc-ribbon domain-containing protein [Micromonospora sp. DH14]|uniref:zinc-ribbon domain-containing protein n=1 Tax=Micromonospora sp. DH14 TaxID=3040120 RepID=UPI00244350D1|nr:zinc-ribbon domain-containing protein [Micromonospora sp. DH14]MDG9679005.1 zinc-ribbon domain-containing protein [Micromonospora sp. DH14]